MATTGSCLCGGIRFRIDAPLAPIQVCHCAQCRKAQGGPFGANIPVELAAFTLLAGEALLASYESTPGKLRRFCSRCGSPVYSARPAIPGVVRVRAGLLDEPVAARVESHAYVASQCSWWPVGDDLPRFPEGRPG